MVQRFRRKTQWCSASSGSQPRRKWTQGKSVNQGKLLIAVTCNLPSYPSHLLPSMASTETETAVVPQPQQVVKKQKKLKPARKQVAPGQVEKKEAPQTGKEYSTSNTLTGFLVPSIDASREQISGTINGPEAIGKTATQSRSCHLGQSRLIDIHAARPNPKPVAPSKKTQVSHEQISPE